MNHVFARNFKIHATVTPRSTRLGEFNRCVLTVSVGAANFSAAKIGAAYEWANRHFGDVSIYLLDRICHIIKPFPPLSSAADEVRADRQAGDRVLTDLEHYRGLKITKLLRFSEVQGTEVFRLARRQVNELVVRYPGLLASIEAEARKYVERQERVRRLVVAPETALARSVEYLQDEIAMQIVIVELGYVVEVYVGQELQPLVELANGSYPDAPPELRNRVNIGLSIRSEGKS